jgi:hypothetical protein
VAVGHAREQIDFLLAFSDQKRLRHDGLRGRLC